MAAQVDAAKKPASAYFLWFNAKREDIQKSAGTKDFGTVGKKASEMWKSISPAEKKPFEEQAKKQKEAFEAFKATPEGQKALEAKKEERKDKKDDKLKKDVKKAAKTVEKDEKLKKPPSAYFMWFNASREAIQKAAGSNDFATVGKKASEMWKAMKPADLKPWEDKQKAAKDAYEKYVKSPEGEAALKAYKDEVAGVKDACKGKAVAAADGEPAAKRTKKAGA
jgi:hypothetical protein